MFSLQQLFGKGDRFYQLLEAAAQESHESVRSVIELMEHPQDTRSLDDLALARPPACPPHGLLCTLCLFWPGR